MKWISYICLIVWFGLIAALHVWKERVPEKSQLANRLTIVVIILGFIGAVAKVSYDTWEKQLEESRKSEAAEVGRLDGFSGKVLDEDRVTVYIGSNAVWIPIEAIGSDRVIKPVSGVKITFVEGGLRVSATAISTDGKVVAQIVNNEWEINPNNYFKKNFDEAALEVIDETGLPVLQVLFLDRKAVKVTGLFDAGEDIQCVTDLGFVFSKRDSLQEHEGDVRALLLEQQKIFQYPSSLYFGERAGEIQVIARDGRLGSPEVSILKRQFAKLSNEAIREKTLDLIQEMRKAVAEYERDNSWSGEKVSAMLTDQQELLEVPLGEVKASVDAFSEKYFEGNVKLCKDYDELFKIRALLLRDELVGRLSTEEVTLEARMLYEYPRSIIPYLMIIEELEKLSDGISK